MNIRFRPRRTLFFLHRWLGVGLCLLFLLWFLSGIGMMYGGYPEVIERDLVAHGVDLDAAAIAVSPSEAFASLGLSDPPLAIRVTSYDGRPVYRFRHLGSESVVYADTGDDIEEVTPQLMRRVAVAWVGQSGDAPRIERLDEVDQWTLQIPLGDLGPLWKYSWPDGQEVYVSSVTGEVVQYTTRASRLGAYLGPVPHWLYFTPLRKHGGIWSRVVIWASALATVASLLGLVIGVWSLRPRWRIPYRGQKRWHLILGLAFGLGAVTWAFSGMLSMEPFPLRTPSNGPVPGGIPDALDALPSMAALSSRPPQAALAALGGLHVRELEMVMVADQAAYLATLADGQTRVVPVDGAVTRGFDTQRLMTLVSSAAEVAGGGDVELLDRYDAYYLDRDRELPLPVIRARMHDADETRYYIDPGTGRIVSTYRTGRWVERWLYHGLHSLRLPGLYTSRPLWDIVMILFMLGGAALAFTSIVLAWRTIGRVWLGTPATRQHAGRVPGP